MIFALRPITPSSFLLSFSPLFLSSSLPLPLPLSLSFSLFLSLSPFLSLSLSFSLSLNYSNESNPHKVRGAACRQSAKHLAASHKLVATRHSARTAAPIKTQWQLACRHGRGRERRRGKSEWGPAAGCKDGVRWHSARRCQITPAAASVREYRSCG